MVTSCSIQDGGAANCRAIGEGDSVCCGAKDKSDPANGSSNSRYGLSGRSGSSSMVRRERSDDSRRETPSSELSSEFSREWKTRPTSESDPEDGSSR